jgi:hypothetical protein
MKREGAGTRGLSARRQRRPRWRGNTFRTTQPEGGDYTMAKKAKKSAKKAKKAKKR